MFFREKIASFHGDVPIEDVVAVASQMVGTIMVKEQASALKRVIYNCSLKTLMCIHKVKATTNGTDRDHENKRNCALIKLTRVRARE